MSSFSKGGSSFLLLLVELILTVDISMCLSKSSSSGSITIVFYDLNFFVLILKVDSLVSLSAKQTVFLLFYSNLDRGSF